ncbi:MAG TPA: serine/threonine-protein kinase [Pseudonocardiaceae bacterium]
MTNPSSRLVAGRYRLGSVLGRGTMGTVWSAHDEMLGRPVAVKEVLLPPGIPDAEADALRERTLREARAIAALSHPNVVTLYDVAREDGAPFVVMELVESRSLAELLKEGALPTQRVGAVGVAVAAALQAAHAAGITHRDVKPGNVLVAHDGRIKLADFGIARNPADQTLTATGLMLGSPAYIAPEIASGSAVSPAADLWGLGATLFAAVEGRPPYDAGGPMATVAAVVQGDIPMPSCTGALAEVIGGLMVKDPARRMPLSQVRRLLGASPASPPPSSKAPSPPAPAPALTAPRPVAPGSGTGQLASDPGPLPFATRAATDTGTRAARRRADGGSTGRRATQWVLAGLLFLGAATGGFSAARVALGASALPHLGPGATPGASTDAAVVLTPRHLQVAGPDGGRAPAQITISVPVGWPEFHEQRVIGKDSGTVVRFVSPDGSEAIAVERIADFLPGGVPEDHLSSYIRSLAQAVPQLVEARRQKLPGGVLDATFRTQEGGGLRRTTYLRLVPARADLWVLQVTVPTEREVAGHTRLFEPVVAGFAPGS